MGTRLLAMAQVDELAEMDLTKGGPEKHDSRFDRIPLRDTEAPVSPRSSSHSPRSPPRSPALASQSRTPNKSPKSGTPRQASASSRNNSQRRSASASPVPTAISMTQEEMEEFEEFLEWKAMRKSTSRSPRSQRSRSQSGASPSPSFSDQAMVPVDQDDLDEVATKLNRQLKLKGDQILNPTRYMKHIKELYATNQYKEARLVLNHCEEQVRARTELLTAAPDVKSDAIFAKTLIWKAQQAARF